MILHLETLFITHHHSRRPVTKNDWHHFQLLKILRSSTVAKSQISHRATVDNKWPSSSSADFSPEWHNQIRPVAPFLSGQNQKAIWRRLRLTVNCPWKNGGRGNGTRHTVINLNTSGWWVARNGVNSVQLPHELIFWKRLHHNTNYDCEPCNGTFKSCCRCECMYLNDDLHDFNVMVNFKISLSNKDAEDNWSLRCNDSKNLAAFKTWFVIEMWILVQSTIIEWYFPSRFHSPFVVHTIWYIA